MKFELPDRSSPGRLRLFPLSNRLIALFAFVASYPPIWVAGAPPDWQAQAEKEIVRQGKESYAKALKGLNDPKTSERDFVQSAYSLGYLPAEAPSVWSDIVGDSHFDDRRRKLALAYLLHRHLKSRVTLSELARLVPKNKLFVAEDFKIAQDFEDFGDKLYPRFYKTLRPRFWKKGNVFYLQIAPLVHPGIGISFYFVLDRKGEDARELLTEALQGDDSPQLKDVRLLDLDDRFDFVKI